MRRPTILGGVVFAFVVSVFALPVWWVLKVALPTVLALRIVALSGYLAYCAYLLATSKTRVGALSLAAANLAAALGVGFLPVSFPSLIATLAIMVSLNRALLFQRSLAAMALDGLTSVTGLMLAGYFFSLTGSIATALWSYFLVQSVFVLIPPHFPGKSGRGPGEEADDIDSFVRGRRQAEAALERIVRVAGE